MDVLHLIVASTRQEKFARSRKTIKRGRLAYFNSGPFVIVGREGFHGGENLCLRWRGPRRVAYAINDYVYIVEDLRNGQHMEVHASHLKFHNDGSLDEKVIMPYCKSSETGIGMQIQRLLKLVEHTDGLKILIRWRGLPSSEDTFELLKMSMKMTQFFRKKFLHPL